MRIGRSTGPHHLAKALKLSVFLGAFASTIGAAQQTNQVVICDSTLCPVSIYVRSQRGDGSWPFGTEPFDALSFRSIRFFNAKKQEWQTYVKPGIGPDFIQEITYALPLLGYWIEFASPMPGRTITFIGNPVEKPGLQFYRGWNAVGFPPAVNSTIGQLLGTWNTAVSFDYQTLSSYDFAILKSNGIQADPSSKPTPGTPYWVKANYDFHLQDGFQVSTQSILFGKRAQTSIISSTEVEEFAAELFTQTFSLNYTDNRPGETVYFHAQTTEPWIRLTLDPNNLIGEQTIPVGDLPLSDCPRTSFGVANACNTLPIHVIANPLIAGPGHHQGEILLWRTNKGGDPPLVTGYSPDPIVINAELLSPPLSGYYHGVVQVNSVNGNLVGLSLGDPVRVASFSFEGYLHPDYNKGTVAFRMDAARTLLCHEDLKLTGQFLGPGNNLFSLSGRSTLSTSSIINPFRVPSTDVLGLTGANHNSPYHPVPIVRHVELEVETERSQAGAIGGYYREDITGILPITLTAEGEFYMEKVKADRILDKDKSVFYRVVDLVVEDPQTHAPIRNVQIRLTGCGYDRTSYTNDIGHVVFDGLVAYAGCSYQLEMTTPGYRFQTSDTIASIAEYLENNGPVIQPRVIRNTRPDSMEPGAEFQILPANRNYYLPAQIIHFLDTSTSGWGTEQNTWTIHRTEDSRPVLVHSETGRDLAYSFETAGDYTISLSLNRVALPEWDLDISKPIHIGLPSSETLFLAAASTTNSYLVSEQIGDEFHHQDPDSSELAHTGNIVLLPIVGEHIVGGYNSEGLYIPVCGARTHELFAGFPVLPEDLNGNHGLPSDALAER